jgi:hypothetical protein
MSEERTGFASPPKSGQWQKGQSGNPGGLPKGVPRISTALQKILRTKPDEVYEPSSKADVLALRLYDNAIKGDTWATREILDRCEGKVTQSLAVTASQLSTSEIVERLVSAFSEAGVEETVARRVILQLSAGDSD